MTALLFYLDATRSTGNPSWKDNPVPVGALPGDVIRARLKSVHTAPTGGQGDSVTDGRHAVTHIT